MNECFVCEKLCPCDCFNIDTDYGIIYFCSLNCYDKSNKEYDWDAEFGEFDGHNAECLIGGNVNDKHREVVKKLKLWRELAENRHRKMLQLKREREQILIWAEAWFDNKRKNNDMWRVGQDELSGQFLDALEKYLSEGEKDEKE